MKRLFLIAASLFLQTNGFANSEASKPVVTAEKYMEYKRENGHLVDFAPPQIVLVCYQQSTLHHLLKHCKDIVPVPSFAFLYSVDEGRVGILGGWGMGAPALSIKMEELIALGVQRFIAVGTAGALMGQHQIGDFIIPTRALAEDGVAHHYLLKGADFVEADKEMLSNWNEFADSHSLPRFQRTATWSFSAMFRETAADIERVAKRGCGVVEIEAATLYAIGQEKGVQTLSIFVISDSITCDQWVPHIKEPHVKNNLNQLAEWALQFCLRQKKD